MPPKATQRLRRIARGQSARRVPTLLPAVQTAPPLSPDQPALLHTAEWDAGRRLAEVRPLGADAATPCPALWVMPLLGAPPAHLQPLPPCPACHAARRVILDEVAAAAGLPWRDPDLDPTSTPTPAAASAAGEGATPTGSTRVLPSRSRRRAGGHAGGPPVPPRPAAGVTAPAGPVAAGQAPAVTPAPPFGGAAAQAGGDVSTATLSSRLVQQAMASLAEAGERTRRAPGRPAVRPPARGRRGPGGAAAPTVDPWRRTWRRRWVDAALAVALAVPLSVAAANLPPFAGETVREVRHALTPEQVIPGDGVAEVQLSCPCTVRVLVPAERTEEPIWVHQATPAAVAAAGGPAETELIRTDRDQAAQTTGTAGYRVPIPEQGPVTLRVTTRGPWALAVREDLDQAPALPEQQEAGR